MNHLYTSILLILIAVFLCVNGFFKERQQIIWLVWFVILFTVDQLVTRLPFIFPAFKLINGNYNWTGKILELFIAVFFILRLQKTFPLEFAFTFKQLENSIRTVTWRLGILFVVLFAYFYYTSPQKQLTFEDIAFQMTLPGLTEEIMFRGVFLGLLNGVFVPVKKIGGVYMGWGAIVTTILFALWHGIKVDVNFHLQMMFFPMLLPLILGFVMVWVREKTKSLVIPILYHGLIDVLITLIGAFK